MARKSRLLAGMVLVLLVFGATRASWAAQDKALVLDLQFDEGKGQTVKDASGKGNNGKIKGAKWVALGKGYALKFDGRASQVEVAANPTLNIGTNPFSVEVWLRPDDLTKVADVISKWGKNEFMLRVGAAYGNRAIFFMTHWERYRLSKPGAIRVGKWTHLAFVKQHDDKGGVDVRCYVNGEDQTGGIGGKPFPADIKGSKNKLYIGGLVGYGYFNGLIGSVRMYKRALTAEEIRAHARAISSEDLSVRGLAAEAPAPPAKRVVPIVNLVTNPSFEMADAGDGKRPKGFVSGHVPGKDRVARLTWEEVGHTGRKAVAVETMHSSDLGYWETTVPVKPQTEYVVSFYYKCRSLRAGNITVGDPAYNKGGPGGPNLELGVAPDDPGEGGKPTNWSDIGLALGPVGGTYLPLTTRWTHYRQSVKTLSGQRRMKIKLRVYCYAQKVWFDDLSVVEAPAVPRYKLFGPAADEVVANGAPVFRWQAEMPARVYSLECSRSPEFNTAATMHATTSKTELRLKQKLGPGRWFWRLGVPENSGLTYWVSQGSFHVAGRTWLEADTTPPTVSVPRPLPNGNAAPEAPISAVFSDVGSGVDVATARILLNGADVTGQAKITKAGFRLRPTGGLAPGKQVVRVSVSDRSGNRSNVLAWKFGVGKALRNTLKIESKRVYLNGRPWFPIGIYSYQCHPADGRFVESSLDQAVAAGFDFTLNTTETKEGLDRLLEHGMMCLLNLSGDMKHADTPSSARRSLLAEGQARFSNHPSVLGYWVDDAENLDNTQGTPLPEITRAKLEHSRKVLRQYTPGRATVFAVSNLPRLRACAQYCDILLAYRYPVPQYHPQMIYGWTLAYYNSVVGEYPIWFNSQAFDLGYGARFKSQEGFRPTPAEMRAMAYYAVVCGSQGYTAYANNISEKATPQHWRELLRMASEMRYLAPVLATGENAATVSLTDVAVSASVKFREYVHGGEHTLIAVNMSGGRIGATWGFQHPVRASALFENRIMAVPERTVSDVFAPFAVHIYRWEQ